MDELKIPKKVLFVCAKNQSGNFIYLFGNGMVSDNKSLKLFTNKYDRLKHNVRNSYVTDIEFDNVPRSGYRVVSGQYSYYKMETVALMSPDGICFKISTQNMFDLICTSKINNSLIEDELFFDEKMILVSTNSKRYKDLVRVQEKKNSNKELSKEVSVGSLLITKPIKNIQTRYTYCGKYHISANYIRNFLKWKESSENVHVLRNEETGNYIITSSLSTGTYLLSDTLSKVDRKTVIEECNAQTYHFNDYSNFNHSLPRPVLFSDKKVKSADLKYTLGEERSYIPNQEPLKYHRNPTLIKSEGKFYMPVNYTYVSNNYYTRGSFACSDKYPGAHEPEVVSVVALEVVFDNGSMQFVHKDKAEQVEYNYVSSNGNYGRIFEPEDYKKFTNLTTLTYVDATIHI